MKKSLEDYKEMVVKPQFDWIKIHWKGWMLIMIISACIPSHRPNQDYYVAKMNAMSFSRFIYPENKEDVLDELRESFKA